MTTPTWRRTVVTIGALGLLSLPLHGVVARAASHTELVDHHPWFAATHFTLLYVLVPLAILSASALFLGPGLMLAIACNRATTLCSWLTTGLALSLVTVSIWSRLLLVALPSAATGARYGLTVLLCFSLCTVVAGLRLRRGRCAPPAFLHDDRITLRLMLGIGYVAYRVRAPTLLWESFNGDGAQAFEASRLLLRHPLPFWTEGGGSIAAFPGMTSMLFAFPNAWFLRLFGEIDAAARIPFLLYFVILFAAIVQLGTRDTTAPSLTARIAATVSLFAYLFTICFSATYSPYSADIALPAAQDTLLIVCFLGATAAYWRRDPASLALFTALTILSLPSGLLLLGFLLLADLVVTRGRSRKQAIELALTIAACVAATTAFSEVSRFFGSPPPGNEYAGFGVVRYFLHLQFTDWSRLALIVIPAGIAPFLLIFPWRHLDREARALTLVLLAYFLFFFVHLHIALHHFVPAMLLPLPVALRALADRPTWQRRAAQAWCIAGLFAVVLSLPEEFGVYTEARKVGRTMSLDLGDYARSEATVFRHMPLFATLFPADWDARVPERAFGGPAISWIRYATHGPLSTTANYRLQPRRDAPPPGWSFVSADSSAALYIRSAATWASDLARRPSAVTSSRWYRLPKWALFQGSPVPHGGPRVFELEDILARVGVDIGPLVGRIAGRQ